METISIQTQNKNGEDLKYKENLGLVTTFLRHQEDKIIIDDFEGQGETYQQRELTTIRVYDNGNLIFRGDKYEFFERLKK